MNLRNCSQLLVCIGTVIFGGPSSRSDARADQLVYGDSLLNGWENWSWATVDLATASPVHSGSFSIGVTSVNYQALYLHHDTFDTSPYASISFWINGGSVGGQSIQMQALRNGTPQQPIVLPALSVDIWQQETISLQSLGVRSVSDFDGFWLQVRDSGPQPTFFVDDIRLTTIPEPSVASLFGFCFAACSFELKRRRV
jgi:alpha-N-arabinofuranosidase